MKIITVFANKLLLEPCHTLIHLHVIRGCLHATTAELSSCDRDLMAYEAENIDYLTL